MVRFDRARYLSLLFKFIVSAALSNGHDDQLLSNRFSTRSR